MTDRTPTLLHLVLAALGVTFFALLFLLALPGEPYDEAGDPAAEVAAAEQDAADSRALRASVLVWAGAGLAIGAAITGGIAGLVLLRQASRRLEEGR